jgi:hypothetical protein
MFSLARRKTTQQQQPAPQMQFAYRQIPTTTYVVNKQVPQVQQQDNLPKMKWGRPIWTFFHVMAQKVKPEYFNLVIRDFLKNIMLVCGTLPCPICSTHASEYMRSINMNNIRTKDDLINLFFNFHNVVNQRKGYAVLQKDQIPKYETANTIAAIKSFVYAFEDKSRSMKLMADDLSRARISSQFKFWINANIQYFDP